MDEINSWIREDYLHQLRTPSRNSGMKYIRRIFNRYLSLENKVNVNFHALVNEISRESSVQRQSVITAIKRFIIKNWEDNFFRTYLAEIYGYSNDTPPAPLDFIRMVCINYEPIINANYGLFMRRENGIPYNNERTYFIHHLLKSPLPDDDK